MRLEDAIRKFHRLFPKQLILDTISEHFFPSGAFSVLIVIIKIKTTLYDAAQICIFHDYHPSTFSFNISDRSPEVNAANADISSDAVAISSIATQSMLLNFSISPS